MFFYLSKIGTFLIDPLFLLILFTCFLWLFSRYIYRLRKLTFLLLLFFYLVSTNYISNLLFGILESTEKPSPLAKHHDAVVVLSGMTRGGSKSPENVEFTDSVDRVLAGMEILKSGKADYLILSGGDGSLVQDNTPESVVLSRFVMKWGIDENRLLLDTRSRNTFENAVNTAEILKKHQLKSVLLITSAFHMIRSRGCFRKVGIDADILPVDFRAKKEPSDFRSYLPSAGGIYLTSNLIHEVVGIVVYWLSDRATYSD